MFVTVGLIVGVGVPVFVDTGVGLGTGIQVQTSKSSQPVSNEIILIPTAGASSNSEGK